MLDPVSMPYCHAVSELLWRLPPACQRELHRQHSAGDAEKTVACTGLCEHPHAEISEMRLCVIGPFICVQRDASCQ